MAEEAVSVLLWNEMTALERLRRSAGDIFSGCKLVIVDSNRNEGWKYSFGFLLSSDHGRPGRSEDLGQMRSRPQWISP